MEKFVDVVIEIPKGGRNKYEYDETRKVFKFDRMLFSSVHYPCDYGFIPETKAKDGDPLDAMVIVWEPTFPGCLIECRPIGVLKMSDEKGIDEKILCVPFKDPLWNHIHDLESVNPHLLKEIKYFFTIYKDLEGKSTTVKNWGDAKEAWSIIKSSRKHVM